MSNSPINPAYMLGGEDGETNDFAQSASQNQADAQTYSNAQEQPTAQDSSADQTSPTPQTSQTPPTTQFASNAGNDSYTYTPYSRPYVQQPPMYTPAQPKVPVQVRWKDKIVYKKSPSIGAIIYAILGLILCSVAIVSVYNFPAYTTSVQTKSTLIATMIAVAGIAVIVTAVVLAVRKIARMGKKDDVQNVDDNVMQARTHTKDNDREPAQKQAQSGVGQTQLDDFEDNE